MSPLNRKRYAVLAGFTMISVALLWAASYAPLKGEYKHPSAREVGEFLLSLFAIAFLVERAVAVAMGLFRAPSEAQLRQRAAIELEDVESAYEPTGDPQAKKAGAAQEGVAEDAALDLAAHEAFTAQYAMAAATIIGFLLAIGGVSTLSTFIKPPAMDGSTSLEFHLFHAMDALLTAGAIGGGSKAVEVMAKALLAFAQSIAVKRTEPKAKAEPAARKPMAR